APLGSLGTFSPATLRIDPQEPATIYLGARCTKYTVPYDGGVYKSTDRGDTWTRLDASVNCVDFLSLDPASPRRLFAGTAWGTQFRTDDAGQTWKPVPGELPVFDTIADPVDPSVRYGLGRGSAATGYLHFVTSANDGTSWSRVAADGLPPGGQQLAMDPATRRLFLLGQSFGLYVSDDLGLHWRHVAAVPVITATSVAMAVAGDHLYVATAQGLFRVPMSDPETPVVIHLGEAAPLRVVVTRLTLDPNDAATVYASGTEGGGIIDAERIFRTTDSGRTWERITPDDATDWRFPLAVDAAGDLYGAATGTMWRFARTTQTWESWTVPELFGPQILLANPQRPGWLYAANSGWAGLSTDGGRSWSRIGNIGSGFWSLSIAPNGSDLVGGNNEGVFASSDGGVTWRPLTTGLVTKAVAVAPSRPETIYRLTNTAAGLLQSGLFRSDDGGATWIALRWPGERDSTLPIAVDPRDERSLWIGLAHSADGGVTWTVEPSTAPGSIRTVAFNRDGTVLWGLAGNYSVWKANVRAPRRRATRG
ncbi:MAG TPA: hypothetical protein VM733_11650, partial [Thermoanaerobaculia bacterium]|nr:hypothetical protein [Thermoanaerobaculia bacterium]